MNYSKKNNNKNIKKMTSNTTKVKSKANLILKKLIIALSLILVFSAIGALAGVYLGILKNAPTLQATSIQPDIYSSQIVSDDTKELYQMLDASEKRIYVTLDYIPLHLQNAFIAIEDSRFYSHNGIDVKGLTRAIYTTITGKSTSGASTITQQLIKNARNLTSNNVVSKLQEQYLAIQFENDLIDTLGSKLDAKQHILELYLNEIALGNGLNGVRTASTFYFDKDVSDLTLSESAVIASITQFPSKLSPNVNPTLNQVRAETVLDYMLEQELINSDDYIVAKNDLKDGGVYTRIYESRKVVEEETSTYSYYTDQVIKNVVDDLVAIGYTSSDASRLVYNGGLTIEIPIDLKIQSILEETYLDNSFFPENQFEIDLQYFISVKNTITNDVKHYERKGTIKNSSEIEDFISDVQKNLLGANDIIIAEDITPTVQPQSSFLVIENSTGAVKGVVGGRGEKTANRSLNRATQSLRQPGSVFKILSVYAPAFDLGLLSPGSTIDDVPLPADKDEHTIKNWSHTYEGLTTARRGIYRSINTLAVRGLELIGVNTSFAYLENFGFTSLVESYSSNGQIFTDKTPSLALGGITDGVSNLELTGAFTAIANYGTYNKPYFYTNVYDHNNVLILSNDIAPKQVISPETAYLLTSTMIDVVTRGTGIGASFSNMSIAGKTGTTSDSKDLIFSGFTPYYTATVLYGYDQPKPIVGDKNVSKNLWRHIMERIHTEKELPNKNFSRPSGIVNENVSLDSGLLPNEYTSKDPRGNRIVSEIFNKRFVPTTIEKTHGIARIDTSTGLLASKFCPTNLVKNVVVLDKDNDFSNKYSYVSNYSTVVLDAKYERPTEFCNVHTSYDFFDNDGFFNNDSDLIFPSIDEDFNNNNIIDELVEEDELVDEDELVEEDNLIPPPPENVDPEFIDDFNLVDELT